MKRTFTGPVVLILGAAVLAPPPASKAAQTDDTPPPAEIVVTARKKPESLAEVPISIQTFDRPALARSGIDTIADLSAHVPGLSSTETAVGTRLYLRGIGSGNNPGFEQSVGQYIDGIHYGRQQLIRAPLFDLERVEVLRGPQGTLFGKSTIAGALNVTTAGPTREPQSALDIRHEFTAGRSRVDGFAAGPLTPRFGARVALRGARQDGYLRNTQRRREEPQRSDYALRLVLDRQGHSPWHGRLKVERNRFDRAGRHAEIVRDDPALRGPFTGMSLRDILLLLNPETVEGAADYRRQADADEFSTNNLDNLTLAIDRDFDNAVLTLLTGFVRQEFTERCDCDHTPAALFTINLSQRYRQLSQEIRLAGTGEHGIDWVAGLFFQSGRLHSAERLTVPEGSPLTALTGAGSLDGTVASRRYRRLSEALALFGQSSLSFRDNWRLTFGSRYTHESQRARRRIDLIDNSTGRIVDNDTVPLVYLRAFKIHSEQLAGYRSAFGTTLNGHRLRGHRAEHSLTPRLTVERLTGDTGSVYLGVTRGFKAGGFDARANNPGSFRFGPERSTVYELGLKHYPAGGSWFSAALFHTRYHDLQISQHDGGIGFNVGNAAGVRIRGLEFNGRRALSGNLELSYAYTWLDYEFTEFRSGNCYNRQDPDGIVAGGRRLCDYTGMRGQFTPEHALHVALDYSRALGRGMELIAGLDIRYTGSRFVHDNLDPNFLAPPERLLSVRLSLTGDSWHAGVAVKNLLNKRTVNYAGNVPMSATAFGTNTYYAFVGKPRQFEVMAGIRF